VEIKGVEAMNMNILVVAGVLFLITLAIVVPILVWSAYRKYRGKRVVICPDTGQPVVVEVDERLAAATAVFGSPSLRLKSCSRWPEKQYCGQECLEQIEATPEELLEKWSLGKVCALCGGPIDAISGGGRYRALMDSAGRTVEWGTIPHTKVLESLATHLPVCWNCHCSRIARPANSGADKQPVSAGTSS
jgi:hypothetical protein